MVKAKVRPWGNSLGVVIPSSIVEELGIRAQDDVTIDIHKRPGGVLKELFGAVKWSKDPRKLLHESRKEIESRY